MLNSTTPYDPSVGASTYGYAFALAPLSSKILCEIIKLEKLFFQATLRMRSAIKARTPPVLRRLFKLESLENRRFELRHRFVSRRKRLVRHGKGNNSVAKVSRYPDMLQAARTGFNLLPVVLSTLGGWHADTHSALCSVATTIAASELSTFSRARSILFQRHAALLVTNNALCLIPGLLSDIGGGVLFVRSTKKLFSNSLS